MQSSIRGRGIAALSGDGDAQPRNRSPNAGRGAGHQLPVDCNMLVVRFIKTLWAAWQI